MATKLNLSEFDESLFTPVVLSGIIDKLFELTQKLPDAIVVTEEQWIKHFFQANEKLTNFRGIPIESPDRSTDKEMAVRTINAILTGMHMHNTKEVSEVYALLENMKNNIGGKS